MRCSVRRSARARFSPVRTGRPSRNRCREWARLFTGMVRGLYTLKIDAAVLGGTTSILVSRDGVVQPAGDHAARHGGHRPRRCARAPAVVFVGVTLTRRSRRRAAEDRGLAMCAARSPRAAVAVALLVACAPMPRSEALPRRRRRRSTRPRLRVLLPMVRDTARGTARSRTSRSPATTAATTRTCCGRRSRRRAGRASTASSRRGSGPLRSTAGCGCCCAWPQLTHFDVGVVYEALDFYRGRCRSRRSRADLSYLSTSRPASMHSAFGRPADQSGRERTSTRTRRSRPCTGCSPDGRICWRRRRTCPTTSGSPTSSTARRTTGRPPTHARAQRLPSCGPLPRRCTTTTASGSVPPRPASTADPLGHTRVIDRGRGTTFRHSLTSRGTVRRTRSA